MATSTVDPYSGIHPDYTDDPCGIPSAAPASRGTFNFPSLLVIDEELAIEFLSTVCLYYSVYGLAFLTVGVIAIVLPVVFVLISVQQMIAWMLVIGGLVSLLHFCFIFGAPGTTSFLFLGVLHLVVGLWLLIQANMRIGMAFVWIMLGWFLVHGLIKLVMGYEIRSIRAWPAIVVSGGTAIVLGIVYLALALALAPALGILGILFGIDLAVTAVAFLLISLVSYQAASRLSACRDPLLEQH